MVEVVEVVEVFEVVVVSGSPLEPFGGAEWVSHRSRQRRIEAIEVRESSCFVMAATTS
jgi:hypothetical protein